MSVLYKMFLSLPFFSIKQLHSSGQFNKQFHSHNRKDQTLPVCLSKIPDIWVGVEEGLICHSSFGDITLTQKL